MTVVSPPIPGRWYLWAALALAAVLLSPPGDALAKGHATQNQNAPAQASSAVRPILVELFTSEGCSSCPPADALLEKLDGFQPTDDTQLVVLSEHVDYWDHDGWKDPNSSSELTERQADYVRNLGLKTAYTPQLIVDGSHEIEANDVQHLDKVLQDAGSAPKIPVRIGDVSLAGGNPSLLQTHVQVESSSEQRNSEVYVAIALNHVESQVLRGENKNRHLSHVAVVVELKKIGKLQKGKNLDETVQLKLKPGTDPKNVRVVAFVQEAGLGKVLGAAVRRPTI